MAPLFDQGGSPRQGASRSRLSERVMTNSDPKVLYQNPFAMTPDEFKAWWQRIDSDLEADTAPPPDIIYLGSEREASGSDH